MRLATFLDQKKIPDSEFATDIGITRQAIHRYKTGARFPEPHILNRIYEITDGQVTPNDFAGHAAEVSAGGTS